MLIQVLGKSVTELDVCCGRHKPFIGDDVPKTRDDVSSKKFDYRHAKLDFRFHLQKLCRRYVTEPTS